MLQALAPVDAAASKATPAGTFGAADRIALLVGLVGRSFTTAFPLPLLLSLLAPLPPPCSSGAGTTGAALVGTFGDFSLPGPLALPFAFAFAAGAGGVALAAAAFALLFAFVWSLP